MAPSLWVGSLVSAVLGNILPGAGTLYLSQNFRFGARVHPGDRLSVELRCVELREKPVAVFEARVVKSDGAVACEGFAEVAAPLRTDRLQPQRAARAHSRSSRPFLAARRPCGDVAAAWRPRSSGPTIRTRSPARFWRPRAA